VIPVFCEVYGFLVYLPPNFHHIQKVALYVAPQFPKGYPASQGSCGLAFEQRNGSKH
jgi:hypothetical protein